MALEGFSLMLNEMRHSSASYNWEAVRDILQKNKTQIAKGDLESVRKAARESGGSLASAIAGTILAGGGLLVHREGIRPEDSPSTVTTIESLAVMLGLIGTGFAGSYLKKKISPPPQSRIYKKARSPMGLVLPRKGESLTKDQVQSNEKKISEWEQLIGKQIAFHKTAGDLVDDISSSIYHKKPRAEIRAAKEKYKEHLRTFGKMGLRPRGM